MNPFWSFESDHILQDALDAYGFAKQEMVMVGEIGELLTLIGRKAQGRMTEDEMIDELADCTIMLRQMAMSYGLDLVNQRIAMKLTRLKERLDQE